MAKISIDADPTVYAGRICDKAPGKKRVLGLDLGTTCGVVFADLVPGAKVEDVLVYMDQWSLALGSYDSAALRHIRLRQFLTILQPDLIGFEEVKYDAPVDTFKGLNIGAIVARVVPTAEFLGGLKTTLSVWSEERQVPLHGYAITAIKKRATGKGNSGKEAMIQACNTRFKSTLPVVDYEKTGADNIADAAHILAMVVEDYMHGL